jgi:hypothetical protein
MVFMHNSPAALQFSKPDGQSKVQRRPLHLLSWLYALHMREGESHIIQKAMVSSVASCSQNVDGRPRALSHPAVGKLDGGTVRAWHRQEARDRVSGASIGAKLLPRRSSSSRAEHVVVWEA